jgi:hypothetical protein
MIVLGALDAAPLSIAHRLAHKARGLGRTRSVNRRPSDANLLGAFVTVVARHVALICDRLDTPVAVAQESSAVALDLGIVRDQLPLILILEFADAFVARPLHTRGALAALGNVLALTANPSTALPAIAAGCPVRVREVVERAVCAGRPGAGIAILIDIR